MVGISLPVAGGLKGTNVQGKVLQLDCLDSVPKPLRSYLCTVSGTDSGVGGWDFFWPEAVVTATSVTMILKVLRRVKNMQSNPVALPLI